MNTFVVGDIVCWRSQAEGHSTVKTGRVVEVVPAGELPLSAACSDDWQRARWIGTKKTRKHESYVVVSKRIAYWPLVKYLGAVERTGNLPFMLCHCPSSLKTLKLLAERFNVPVKNVERAWHSDKPLFCIRMGSYEASVLIGP